MTAEEKLRRKRESDRKSAKKYYMKKGIGIKCACGGDSIGISCNAPVCKRCSDIESKLGNFQTAFNL